VALFVALNVGILGVVVFFTMTGAITLRALRQLTRATSADTRVVCAGTVGALLWFLVVSAGYALILPGLILHMFNIVSAAASAHRLNSSTARLQLEAGGY
jgi:hypothetical protein